jgi:phosphoenolpyruvate carboxylase
VLAVLLLARWADITDKRTGECPLDVAPLLESIDRAGAGRRCAAALYAEPAYRRHLASRGDRQMVVIGYSDTNKEGGIAASRWALQVAQTLLEAAREAGITLTIFHGRGGTPARGGGRTENLVEAAPHGAIRGCCADGAGRGRQSKLWPAADRDAHAGTHLRAVALATAHAGPHRRPAGRTHRGDATIAARSLEAYRELVFAARSSSNTSAPRRRST